METWVTGIPANRNRNIGGGGLRTITTRDIRYVKALQMGANNSLGNGWNETRPVFLIMFRDNSTLVVTGEYNALRGGGGSESTGPIRILQARR